ncbi:hypothetical protein BGX27_006947 [Mortierella sp. AM989]|nr:hypothetical protein BGX27_006947 [Mortierella sp. AM989]
MNAVAEAQKDHSTGLYSLLTSESPSTTDVFEQQVLEEPWFGDDTIGLLGLALADLRQITIINNPNLTSAGLIRYSEHFNGLTRLNLECCRSIEPEGFGTLIERSPSLTHIQLGNTQANDQTLFKLSSPPSRASTLKVLSVFRCQGVTNLGIKSIVTFCQNLQSLDFTMCSLVSIDIFDEPTWECSQLETLLMSGISQGADLGTLEVPRPARRRTISATALSSMYKQLGRLKRLRELDIGGMPFDLNLFQMGHRDLEALERLRILRLVNTTKLLTRKEITWLATRFNDLEYLALDKGGVDSELLLQDLMDINPRIRIDRIDRTDTTVPRTVQFPQFDGALPPHDDIDNESEVESHATSDSGHIDTLMDSEPDSYHGMDEDMDSDSHFGASPSNEFVSDSEDELIRLRQEEEEEDEEEHQRILQDDEEELERMRLEEEEEEEELKRLREEEEEEEEEELRRLREEEEEEEEEELRRLREEEEEEEAEELRRLREEEEEEAEEELRMQREMEEDEDDTNISGSDGDIYSRQKSSSPDYPSPGNGDLNDADEDMESIDGGPSDAEANASNNQGIDSYSEGSDGSDVEDDDNDEHDSSHFSSDNIDSDDY